MSNNYLELIKSAENKLKAYFSSLEDLAFTNQQRVLEAFWAAKVSDFYFKGSTGYGYDDAGREAIDSIYASFFGAEAALVRPHFVSGTHAIGAAMLGNLKPGQHIISVCGTPYDTMLSVIGDSDNPANGTLRDMGISYDEVPLTINGKLDFAAVKQAIKPTTKMMLIQRSRGYAWREALSVKDIGEFCQQVKAEFSDILLLVDNCYGEFTDIMEPTQVGADLVAGSLIKNPGGGLAISGGYVAGAEVVVKRTAERLTMPGLGAKLGAMSSEQIRLILQGFFLAPHVVSQTLKGLTLIAEVLTKLGLEVSPQAGAQRSDIIQAIRVHDAETICRLAVAVQRISPVDAHVLPEPWDMPGYNDPIIMAAGAFVQGSSLELSLDAPIREPYTAYLQGGLTYEHLKIALLEILKELAV